MKKYRIDQNADLIADQSGKCLFQNALLALSGAIPFARRHLILSSPFLSVPKRDPLTSCCLSLLALNKLKAYILSSILHESAFQLQLHKLLWRSEERRVGKECRSRCSPYH